MRTIVILMSFMAAMQLFTLDSYAQQRPSGRDSTRHYVAPSPQEEHRRQVAFYRRSLGGDSIRAVEVSAIMDAYKAAMKAVSEDKGMSQEARRSRYGALIEEKNQKLRRVLSPEQQSKLIPSGRGKSSASDRNN